MPDYATWEELVDAAQKKCRHILEKDVAPVVKEIVKRHIETDIYAAYTPRPGAWVGGATYQRRRELPSSVYALMRSDEELLVTSDAKVSKPVVKGYSFHHRRPGAFLQLLESGNMGLWRNGFSRPAVGNAQMEINSSSKIRNAIKQGLQREFGG